MTPLLTIRSTAARVGAWAWMAFAALNLVDIALRGRDMASLVMVAFLLLGCGIAYALGLRPAVVADEQGITVRNPLRDVRIPWGSSRKIEGADALTFLFTDAAAGGERKAKAWVHQTSPRARAKAEARQRRQAQGLPDAAAAALKHNTPTSYAAQQLNELARAHKPKVKASAARSKDEAKPREAKSKGEAKSRAAKSGDEAKFKEAESREAESREEEATAKDREAEGTVAGGTISWSRPAVMALAIPTALVAVTCLLALAL